jgi:hypothetical protein
MGYSYLASIGCLVVFNMVFIVIKAVKKFKRAKEIKAMKKAHDARVDHENEMRRITFLESDEYIIQQYEKKYGFDLLNKKMFVENKKNEESEESFEIMPSPIKKEKKEKKSNKSKKKNKLETI